MMQQPTNVVEYLESLQRSGERDVFRTLYDDFFTSLTVFRTLPPLAKQFCMRLVALDACVQLKPLIEAWVRPSHPQSAQYANEATRKMFALQLLVIDPRTSALEPAERSVQLDPAFARSLRMALVSGITASTEGDDAKKAGFEPPSTSELLQIAQSAWDKILYFVIGSRDSERYVSGTVIQLLTSIGVATDDRSETSAAAFQFLFQALGSQLWRLLMCYTALASINRNDFLRFLFRLSFMNVGVAYAIPASAQQMIRQLSEFGLVYIDPRAPSYFIPTPFIAHLSTSAASTSSGSAAGTLALTSTSDLLRSGYIIVETTFVVYAYTSSPLHIALLRTFMTIHRELPNLVIGKITKESVRQAITRGISKNEILCFLEHYAHPRMRQQIPVLPNNITQQMEQWEREKHRISTQAAFIFSAFDSEVEFHEYCRLAAGHILLAVREKLILVVNEQGNQAIINVRVRR